MSWMESRVHRTIGNKVLGKRECETWQRLHRYRKTLKILEQRWVPLRKYEP
jgi:hypothetical protein